MKKSFSFHCLQCKRAFESSDRRAKYCRRQCRNAARYVQKKNQGRGYARKWCKWCGNDLHGSPRYITHEFCSEPCFVSYCEDVGADHLLGLTPLTLHRRSSLHQLPLDIIMPAGP